MGKFTNIEIHTEPETTLFPQEVNAILSVINQVLVSLSDHYPVRGTFILDGQKTGEEARCILRFDLEDGPAPYTIEATKDTSSDELAERAINSVLSWPEKWAPYPYTAEDEQSGQFSSKVYRRSELRVLVLNTAYGRFLASCYIAFSEDTQNKNIAVLNAVAEVLARMGKEDEGLQQSIHQLRNYFTPVDKEISTLINRLFDECSIPELKAWRDWHEPANTSGDLTLFFE
jgi:hypothetical protein